MSEYTNNYIVIYYNYYTHRYTFHIFIILYYHYIPIINLEKEVMITRFNEHALLNSIL